MRLTEAVKQSGLGPLRNAYRNDRHEPTCACYLGRVYDGAGGDIRRHPHYIFRHLRRLFPGLKKRCKPEDVYPPAWICGITHVPDGKTLMANIIGAVDDLMLDDETITTWLDSLHDVGYVDLNADPDELAKLQAA